MPSFSTGLFEAESKAHAEYQQYAIREGHKIKEMEKILERRKPEHTGRTAIDNQTSSANVISNAAKRKRDDCDQRREEASLPAEFVSEISDLKCDYRDQSAERYITTAEHQNILARTILVRPLNATISARDYNNKYAFSGRKQIESKESNGPKPSGQLRPPFLPNQYALNAVAIPVPVASAYVDLKSGYTRPFKLDRNFTPRNLKFEITTGLPPYSISLPPKDSRFVVEIATDLPSFPLALPPRDADIDIYAHRRRYPEGDLGSCRDASLEKDYVPSWNAHAVAVFDVSDSGRGDMDSWMWGAQLQRGRRTPS